MAVTHEAKTNGAGANPGYSLLSYQVTDGHHFPSSVSIRVVPTITTAQMDAIGEAIEDMANIKVCSSSLTHYFDVSGGKAAAAATLYPDKYNLARLGFASSANCREKTNISIPAPLETIFSGVGNVVLDNTDPLVTALVAALAGVLSGPDGATDYGLDTGYRDTRAMPTPTGI